MSSSACRAFVASTRWIERLAAAVRVDHAIAVGLELDTTDAGIHSNPRRPDRIRERVDVHLEAAGTSLCGGGVRPDGMFAPR